MPAHFSHPALRDHTSHTVKGLIASYRKKERSVTEQITALISYQEAANPSVNALTSIQRDAALARARHLDASGPNSGQTLFGVPVVLKENIQKIGFPVECASKILKGYRGQFDATAVQRLEAAGAVIVATANMDEFAMGSSNEHSVHGPVRNPHDLALVSGGSSGGSAVATTVGFSAVSLGSDTGGSVRQPAAYCGIFGFKPTYGRVSRYGLVAYGSSLDQISPFARSAEDLETVVSVIAGEDPMDATTLRGPFETWTEAVPLKGLRVAVPRKLLAAGVSPNVLAAQSRFEADLKAAGAEIRDVEIPGLEHTLSVYYLTACAEASSNLARFDGIRYGHRTKHEGELAELYARSRSEGFGDEVKLRIMLGTFALSAGYYDAFYGRAQAIRTLMTRGFEEVFAGADVILMPTAPTSAFPVGQPVTDPVQVYLNDVFTIPGNLTGVCCLSMPAPVATAEMPVGLQLFAPKNADAKLLALARSLEATGLVRATPLAGGKA